MYQAWQWGGTPATNPAAAGYVPSPAAGQIAQPQWPSGYNQYAAMTPEMQQQWAAWQQYAYTNTVPVGQVPTTTSFTTTYPEYQTAKDPQPPTTQSNTTPSENQTTSAEELAPKDNSESKKLKELEEKALQWKSSQQPPAAASTWAYPTTTEPPKAPVNDNVSIPTPQQQSQFDKEEEEFEKQFKEWEKEFENWKESNQNHPDKEAFAQYEKQWQEWRKQLLQKKEQMQKAKADRLAAAASSSATASMLTPGVNSAVSIPAPTSAESAVSVASAGMYYPPSQYMYMQPYMYPGNVPAPPPPSMPTAMPPQFPPYGAPPGPPTQPLPYGNPPLMPVTPGDPSMPPAENPNMRPGEGYGPNNFNYNPNGEEEAYQEYGDPGMYPPENDEQYRREMNFARGRARGRGRGRGRGGRWSEGVEIEGPPGGMRGPPGLLETPDLKGPAGFRGMRGEYDGPQGNFHDRFMRGGPREFPDGPEGENLDGPHNYPEDGQDYPPDMPFPDNNSDMPFPSYRGGRRPMYPDERDPYSDQPDPPFHENQGGPPGPYRGGRGSRFRGGPNRFREGPSFRNGPHFRDGPPFRDGPLMHDGPPSFRDRPLLPDGPQPQRDGPLSRDKPLMRDGPPDASLDGPTDVIDEPPLHRYPPDDFDEEFPPGPPFDDQFPPENEQFPPPRDIKEERFMRGRDCFPPNEDDFGPFDPPFDDRFPPGRGRFPSRGRRFPRGEFDRFDNPPFPGREDEPFGPDFSPDERFHSRMPPGRGPRPPFEPKFRPRGPPRFSDDPFLGDCPPGPPMRFKTVDYTHRPAASVIGEDFNRHYEYESEFQDDVAQFRDNFNYEMNLAPSNPIIFSQAKLESFDYGHGLDPSSAPSLPGNNAVPVKVFDYSHRGDGPLPPRDRMIERNNERPPYREKDRDTSRLRERDRNRDKEYDRGRRDRDRERDSKRDRDWDRKPETERVKRSKWDCPDNVKADSKETSTKRESSDAKDDISFKPPNDSIGCESSSETTLIEDILSPPKRFTRPKQLVVILRGLPGSGKTYVAKLIKDKEIANGGSAPRILSLDDYFMVEQEVTDTDPDTGKRLKRKEFKFEYELEMEESYRASLFKSFKKTIDDRFFPFIIVDAVHDKSKQYEQFWSYAKQRGFQVYIAEMDCKDPVICHKRNIHNRTLEDITKLIDCWEKKPRHFMSIDVRSLLQDVAITEVEMEVEGEKITDDKNDSDTENDPNSLMDHVPSRWEKLEATEEKLDQLDGLRLGKKKHSSMEDYLQLPDDYEERKCEPGKKRVRWADLEERKEQDRLRAIGFVVGQTDWNKLTDPTHADRALTKTKYF